MAGKPEMYQLAVFDYLACAQYIEDKYGVVTTRGYTDGDGEYRDFWNFVVDTGGVSNGAVFSMCEWWFDGCQEWQRKIGLMFLDEFGEQADDAGRVIPFHVWW